MALIKKPVTGMRDILPKEMRVRDYCIGVIRDTYARYGFTEIETPVVESLANLSSKQGGENEKLIFKVMKRGEKLRIDTAQTENDLADSGLRYDLTVPLVRYYANHSNELPTPFKALQMGNVFRADRPQRGRFRQFMQCDIDILGEAGSLAEIELIGATTTVLGKLGFKDFRVRINDRRILKAMAAYSSFPEEAFDSVCIALDKLDKIGAEGVREELLKEALPEESVDRYLSLLMPETGTDTAGAEDAVRALERLAGKLGDSLAGEIRDSLAEIIASVEGAKDADFRMVFDPTLVRGMGYYTGTIFEVSLAGYDGSCGGGGRYDKMVGLFTGQETPACGFSIGFERIIMILMEEGFTVPEREAPVAFLIEKGIGGDRLAQIMKEAQKLRGEGRQVLVARMMKNKKHQKEQLSAQGYTAFQEYYEHALKN